MGRSLRCLLGRHSWNTERDPETKRLFRSCRVCGKQFWVTDAFGKVGRIGGWS